MAANPPESLKTIKPFLTIAKQYEPKDKVVAYYLYMYATQTGLAKAKNDMVAKQFLLSVIGKMEILKKEADSEAVKSEVVGQAYLEEVALKLFHAADENDREAKFNRNMIKAFYTSSFLMEALTQFGEPSEDVVQKQKYARWKAAEISRCIKSGIQPTSGPPGGDDIQGLEFSAQPTFGYSGNTAMGSDVPPSMYPPPSDGQGGPPTAQFPPPSQPPVMGFSQPYPPPSDGQGGPPTAQFPPPSQPPVMGFSQPYPPPVGGVPVYPDPHDSASKPIPKPRQQQPQLPSVQASYEPTDTGHHAELTYVEFQQAAKLARHAASALDYEDVTTAVKNLNKALKLLQTGKEN